MQDFLEKKKMSVEKNACVRKDIFFPKFLFSFPFLEGGSLSSALEFSFQIMLSDTLLESK